MGVAIAFIFVGRLEAGVLARFMLRGLKGIIFQVNSCFCLCFYERLNNLHQEKLKNLENKSGKSRNK
jgi:hypothetical protein